MFMYCITPRTLHSIWNLDLKSAIIRGTKILRLTFICLRNDFCNFFFRLGIAAGPVAGRELHRAYSFLSSRQSRSWSKNYQLFYRTRWSVAVFTTRHWMVYCARLIQSCSKAGLKFDSI
jgi:hypothetical protein